MSKPPKSPPIMVRMTPDMHTAITAVARDSGTSVSAIIRAAVANELPAIRQQLQTTPLPLITDHRSLGTPKNKTMTTYTTPPPPAVQAAIDAFDAPANTPCELEAALRRLLPDDAFDPAVVATENPEQGWQQLIDEFRDDIVAAEERASDYRAMAVQLVRENRELRKQLAALDPLPL